MLAGLPYVVWPIGSLFILASRKKEDAFLHYHAVQALLFGAVMAAFVFVVFLGLFIGFRVLPGSASYLPAVLGIGTLLGGGAVSLIVLLTAVFLGWRATEGEMIRIPYLGDYAEEKMLDQSGMTRRQFQEMCERSMISSPVEEEEIQFPDMPVDTPEPSQETAMDRLEAARQARAAQEQRTQSSQRTTSQNITRETRELPDMRLTSSLPESRLTSPLQPRQPVVRDVDLISHYKDNKVETGVKGGHKNADVLRQWLSSVDEP